MVGSFTNLPDFNDTLVILLKDQEVDQEVKVEEAGQIFLGVVFQAIMMCRWNLSWIFCDVMLDSDFHAHSIHSKKIRESTGLSLMAPSFGGLTMSDNNMVEVGIIGLWSAFALLHLWLPAYN